jgi:hypothetical protein
MNTAGNYKALKVDKYFSQQYAVAKCNDNMY